VTILAILVFVPIRYAYPSRMTDLRMPTILLGLVWGIALMWAIVTFDGGSLRTVVRWSLLYPVYYVAISLYLHAKHATA
jgi:phosphatidylcholine synthase